MNKYEIRTQRKKRAIIEAALNLFQKKGYTNTSINEVAAIASVSPVSIYNYFGSKEGLVKECASMLLEESQKIVMTLLTEKIGFKEKLLRVVSLCSEKPYEILDKYFSKEALEDKVFIDLFQAGVNEIRLDILSEFIECGKEEGAINPNISTDNILDFLSATASVQNKWETQQEYKDKSGDLYQLILYGLIGS
jgi:AcrR family transcriptional regulator